MGSGVLRRCMCCFIIRVAMSWGFKEQLLVNRFGLVLKLS